MGNREELSKFYRGNLVERVDATKMNVKVTPLNAEAIDRINRAILLGIKSRKHYCNEQEMAKTLAKRFKCGKRHI